MDPVTGKVQFIFDEQSHLVTLSFAKPGESDAEHTQMAHEMRRDYDDLVAHHPNLHCRVLVDLTNAGVPSKEATKIYIDTLGDSRIDKTAIYGVGMAIQSIINFIVGASGRGKNVQFFVDKDKAIEWLEAN